MKGRATLIAVAAVALVAVIAIVAAVAGGGSGVEAAPDFQFGLYQGEEALGGGNTHRISDLRGKPLVLNFWAGLCPPCRAEMPDLQAFYDEYRDEVTLVGVDVGIFTGLGSQQDGQDLLSELGITYPTGFTSDPAVVRRYEILSMPTTVFITSEGEIFRKWEGFINREALTDVVGEMLASPST